MATAVYTPRRPQETLIHQLVSEHLDDFLEQAQATYRAPLPKYVVQALRKFLSCGDFTEGFVRCSGGGGGGKRQ